MSARHIVLVHLPSFFAKIVGFGAGFTYTVGHKNRDTFIFSITHTNIDRFS